ncbi:MAG: hypothetical protein WAP11_04765 [Acetomicrobium sp.]
MSFAIDLKDKLHRLEIGATICGICIAACPWTKRYLGSKNIKSGR